eukprot:ANDGO_03408.mRNA.1 Osmotically inducible protein C
MFRTVCGLRNGSLLFRRAFGSAPSAKSTVKTFAIQAQGNGMATMIQEGKHTLLLDEPASFGGGDNGTTPLHAVLGALAGCEQVLGVMIAREMGIRVGRVEYDVSGDVDVRGLFGVPGVPVSYQTVKVVMKVDSQEPMEALQKWARAVEQRCPVCAMLHNAGVKMSHDLQVMQK